MPTYEYECPKCNHVFEVFQSMTEERIKKCPKCGGKVKRLIGTGAGVIFKGSGFYETDYRSSDYQSAAKKESSSSSSAPVSKDSKKSKSDDSKKAGKSKSLSSSENKKKVSSKE